MGYFRENDQRWYRPNGDQAASRLSRQSPLAQRDPHHKGIVARFQALKVRPNLDGQWVDLTSTQAFEHHREELKTQIVWRLNLANGIGRID